MSVTARPWRAGALGGCRQRRTRRCEGSRELEFVELLSYLKRRRVRNVVWLTADVHYCAAHYYNPPWPRSAISTRSGSSWPVRSTPARFGPNALDGTFGPQVVFFKAPPPGQSNLSPYSGLQFFGEVNIHAQQRRADRRFSRHQWRIGVQQDTAATNELVELNLLLSSHSDGYTEPGNRQEHEPDERQHRRFCQPGASRGPSGSPGAAVRQT